MIRLRHSEQRCAVRAASGAGSFILPPSSSSGSDSFHNCSDTRVRIPEEVVDFQRVKYLRTYGENDVSFPRKCTIKSPSDVLSDPR